VRLVGCISLEASLRNASWPCGAGNVCLAGELSARLSLHRLTHLDRSVTIDGYTKVSPCDLPQC
jgi:hypothetical protein